MGEYRISIRRADGSLAHDPGPQRHLSPQPPVGKKPFALFALEAPQASCLRLFLHWSCRAASRAACTAGNNSAIRMPMIVMTTKNSTRVKARGDFHRDIAKVHLELHGIFLRNAVLGRTVQAVAALQSLSH